MEDPRTNKYHILQDVIFDSVAIGTDDEGNKIFVDAEATGKIVNVRPSWDTEYRLNKETGENELWATGMQYVYNIICDGDELIVYESAIKRLA